MQPDERARRWDLVVRHRERLLPIALARTACRADAEDAVQEAMLRAVSYDALDEARLSAFLTTVTVRLCVDQHRVRTRELRAGTAVLHSERDDAGPEPDVCDRAEAAWAVTVLAKLPERQREVVEFRATGADLAETAKGLHLSYKAVESALSRARTQVRAAMAAGVGAVLAFARRSKVAVAPATALTALSLTALVVGVEIAPAGEPVRPRTTPPRVTTLADARDGEAASRTGSGASGARAVRATAGRAARGAAPPAGPPTERVVYVPGPGGNDIAVTRRDTPETTAQLAERCVTGGYTIENGSGRCTKQENDPGAYPVSDAIDAVVPPIEGAP